VQGTPAARAERSRRWVLMTACCRANNKGFRPQPPASRWACAFPAHLLECTLATHVCFATKALCVVLRIDQHVTHWLFSVRAALALASCLVVPA
jgi:hypothetical protein